MTRPNYPGPEHPRDVAIERAVAGFVAYRVLEAGDCFVRLEDLFEDNDVGWVAAHIDPTLVAVARLLRDGILEGDLDEVLAGDLSAELEPARVLELQWRDSKWDA
jgi:hypothetical protein